MSPSGFGALVGLDNFHLQNTAEFSLEAGLYIFSGETISEFANKDLEIMEVLSDENLFLSNDEFLTIADVFNELRGDHNECLILALFFDELYIFIS